MEFAMLGSDTLNAICTMVVVDQMTTKALLQLHSNGVHIHQDPLHGLERHAMFLMKPWCLHNLLKLGCFS
jgi:hypothetical protein